MRTLLLAVLGAAWGCAAGGNLVPVSSVRWIPGTYEFESRLGSRRVVGRTVVEEDGPVSLITTEGACTERLPSRPYQTRGDFKTFDCGSDYRVTVRRGTERGRPITGDVSNTVTSSRQEVTGSTCVRPATAPSGDQFCLFSQDQTRTVAETKGDYASFSRVERIEANP